MRCKTFSKISRSYEIPLTWNFWARFILHCCSSLLLFFFFLELHQIRTWAFFQVSLKNVQPWPMYFCRFVFFFLLEIKKLQIFYFYTNQTEFTPAPSYIEWDLYIHYVEFPIFWKEQKRLAGKISWKIYFICFIWFEFINIIQMQLYLFYLTEFNSAQSQFERMFCENATWRRSRKKRQLLDTEQS